ncbi:hypothetical protein DCAR_0314352 [Daucus carota subsp. sativus]|uniref:PGG domain-containing protein n=1 Tax=Daucus carota subsp. sativus TaxID=79200 RepID=A0AAF0WVQ5_DAUCS|nr:hypothetical protein DCAR_0314352 [Daucus carota subsp. sativus]
MYAEEQQTDYMKICVPLHSAALRGDWHAADIILRKYPKVINMSITHREDTVLHIAASTKHTYFAEKLVTKIGGTALWLAVASTEKMVDILLKRNKGLLKIRTRGRLPLMCAIWSGHKDIVEYMYSMTDIVDEKWKVSDKKSLLNSCIVEGLFDIALKIMNDCKKEGTLMIIGTEVLRYLASKPAAFDGKIRPFLRRLVNKGSTKIFNIRNLTKIIDNIYLATHARCLVWKQGRCGIFEIVRYIWGEIVKQKHDDILKIITAGGSKKKKAEGFLFIAARLGNYKFIIELLRLFPEIAWHTAGDNNYTIFHVAVINRQENVYKLLYELGAKKMRTLDKDGNNILHLAAIKPPQSRLNNVSGAALQMQRELLWFKEVSTRVHVIDRRQLNKEGKTPQVLFTEQHADMVEKGEIWMKHTAAQCMVVATLIATIMFAAAFTLPGGNNGDNGHPIFRKKTIFIIFVVADATSLCASSASILMFLAILTARYTENDFLVSLPWKLMAGFSTLFISIATMMVAFSASFFILYAESLKWIPILVATFAAAPVISFAMLQYRLLLDVIKSALMSRHLFRSNKRMI